MEIFVVELRGKKNLFFSETLKHTSITVTDKMKVTQKNSYNINFALVEPRLEGKKKLRDKRSMKIHIDHLTSWIAIGIGLKNQIAKAEYYFDSSLNGHGAFMLSNNGYTWHHSNMSKNSHYCKWRYKQG